MGTAAIIASIAVLILCACFGFERVAIGIDILKYGRNSEWDIEFDTESDEGSDDDDPADYWKK